MYCRSTIPKPGDKLVGMSTFFRESLQRVISDKYAAPTTNILLIFINVVALNLPGRVP